MATVTQTTPVVQTGEDNAPSNAALSKAEQEAIAGNTIDGGEKKIGEYFVRLDENNAPVGGLLEEPPKDGPYVRVSNVAGALKPEVLMTPSGAPLTNNMNPEHSVYDEALERRNPRPGLNIRVGDKIETTKDGETVVKDAETGKTKSATAPAKSK